MQTIAVVGATTVVQMCSSADGRGLFAFSDGATEGLQALASIELGPIPTKDRCRRRDSVEVR